tara:strand:+ start:103 stop:237 length:135 start_codon:yes stop_codon:yes gene_type:complete
LKSWRFISLADWHDAEKHIMNLRNKNYKGGAEEKIATLKLMASY